MGTEVSPLKSGELPSTETAFHWATEWSGHEVAFHSDSLPTLMLLKAMYVEASNIRYSTSNDFRRNNLDLINFKISELILTSRFSVMWEANTAA